MTRVLFAAATALALSACSTPDIVALMQAAEEYDEGCYKDTSLTATPVLIFGWPVPLISGSHRKVCNPDEAPADARAGLPPSNFVPLTVGRTVGSPPVE